MKKLFVGLCLFQAMNAFAANAPISPIDGYQVTDFKSVEELAPLWQTMKGKEYLKSKTNCYDRAHAWSWDLYKKHNVFTKKMILHYTARYMKELNGGWSWHVAPMVTVQGKEYVLDKQFFSKPVPKAEWLAFFIKPGISKLKFERDKLVTKIKNAQWKIDRIREGNGKFFWASIGSYREDIQGYRAELRKLGVPEQGEVTMKCDEITHIESLDYGPSSNWCYLQEAAMFYLGLPELRMLNYGTSSMKRLPLRENLPQARAAGMKYKKDSFSFTEVWQSKSRAFKDPEKLWYWEHLEYERLKDRN